MSHTLFFDPPDPPLAPPGGPIFSICAIFSTWYVVIWSNEEFELFKVSYKLLESTFTPGGAKGGSGGPWTHFSTDFQNIDYFWNLQARAVLVGSLVLLNSALEMKNNWFWIFAQNLGLSQKITLCLISQQKSWVCKFCW